MGSVQSKFHRVGVDLVAAAQILILNGIFRECKYRIVLIIRNKQYMLNINFSGTHLNY